MSQDKQQIKREEKNESSSLLNHRNGKWVQVMKLFRGIISRWQFTTTRYVTWKSTTRGVTDAKEEENAGWLC